MYLKLRFSSKDAVLTPLSSGQLIDTHFFTYYSKSPKTSSFSEITSKPVIHFDA